MNSNITNFFQVRVQVRVQKFLFFEFVFGQNCRVLRVRVRSPGLYIKNCYKFNLIDELTIMNGTIFKSIFIKIQLHSENLFCGNIYRSPSNDSRLK